MRTKNFLAPFVLLLGLIVIWSTFFGMYKYYYWGLFEKYAQIKNLTEGISLEEISGNLSIGSIIAFALGSVLFRLFKERVILIGISLLSLVSILCFTLFFGENGILFSLLSILIGTMYGFWSVVRNILISMEISRTKLPDTLVNGLANIFFIVSLIVGSVLGGKIIELFGEDGIMILLGFLSVGLILSFFARYSPPSKIPTFQEQQKSISIYISEAPKDFLHILRTYAAVMILSAALLVIATIVSQKAIEYSVQVLAIKQSSATMLLLFSAVGSIIGNIVTLRVTQSRWKFFIIGMMLFSGLLFSAQFFLASFQSMAILASLAGIFFGLTFNLIESYFFRKIGEDNLREFGSVTYGMICSGIIAFLMFFVDAVFPVVGFVGVFQIMAFLIGIMGITAFYLQKQWA